MERCLACEADAVCFVLVLVVVLVLDSRLCGR
jgi:hypothetical protein